MSESLNSTSDSTRKKWVEEVADLTQNQDEVLDLGMAFGALGGLRHDAACTAAERSTRRFDERQHRLHEARMKALGMEGEEKEPEAEDMSQQVLIRSPIIHNHYGPAKQSGEQPQRPTSEPPSPPQVPPSLISGLSPLAKAAIASAIGLSTIGTGAGLYSLATRGTDTTVIEQPVDSNEYGVGLVPPGPPHKERSP